MKEKDEIIVQRVLAGDTEAFSELVDKYKGAVFALAFHKIGNFEDAKDISQEAFIKAYTKLPELRNICKLAEKDYLVSSFALAAGYFEETGGFYRGYPRCERCARSSENPPTGFDCPAVQKTR
jgi:hypothetical protein